MSFPRALARVVAAVVACSIVVTGAPTVSAQDEVEPLAPPAALAQLRPGGVTSIPVGGSTTDGTIELQASISHPAGKSVQLHVQVALVGDDNFILPVQSVTSPLGGGGKVAVSVTLDPNPYHWRCRTIDALGDASAWIEFGNNRDSTADFSVLEPVTEREVTLAYSLPSGSSLISVPICYFPQSPSTKPSDVFKGLPANAVVQEWDPVNQRYLDPSETVLAPGKAYRVDLFAPAELEATGVPNDEDDVYVDLEPGWNLIGVPFERDVTWAGVHVVTEGAPVTLDDAIKHGWLDERIYAWDSSGRVPLESGDPLRALKGYSFFANEPDLRLKISRPPLLRAVEAEVLKVLVKGLVKGALKYTPGAKDSSIGQMLEMIGLVDFTKERLIQIDQKLDAVIASQKRVESKLDDLARQLAISTTEIKKYTEEAVNILPVITALKTHYDDKGSATISLGYYYEKAKNLAELEKVDRAGVDQFASDLLRTWNFVEKFNAINTAITSPLLGHDGVLDAWAQEIILKDTNTGHSLITHYKAMEAYFAQLLHLQLKCAHLVVEAYQRLGNKSGSGYSPTDADTFMAKTYKPAIDAEIEVFLKTVEYLAVAKADWTKTRYWRSDMLGMNGRFLTDDAREMLARADFFAAQWRGEDAKGVVGRVITSEHVIWWSKNLTVQAPTSQSVAYGTQRVIDGPMLYPSWTGAEQKYLPYFYLTKKWRVARFVLTSTSPTTYGFALPGWILSYTPFDVVNVTTQRYDDEYNPSSSGTNVFGSLTFDIRVSSPEVLNPYGGAANAWDYSIRSDPYKYNTTRPSRGHAAIPEKSSIDYSGNGVVDDEQVEVWRSIKYSGTQEATATFAASYDVSSSYVNCGGCSPGAFQSCEVMRWTYQLYIWDATARRYVASFDRTYRQGRCRLSLDQPSVSVTAANLTPGHEYRFGLRLRMHQGFLGSGMSMALIAKFTSMSLTNVALK